MKRYEPILSDNETSFRFTECEGGSWVTYEDIADLAKAVSDFIHACEYQGDSTAVRKDRYVSVAYSALEAAYARLKA